MTRTCVFPVVGRLEWGFGSIACFFDYDSAYRFIRDEAPERTLYMGEPQYAAPYTRMSIELRKDGGRIAA